jgi:competence protein ComEC
LFIPFVAGLGLAAWLDTPFPWLRTMLIAGLALGAILSTLSFAYRFRWLFGVFLNLLLLLFGYDLFIRHHEGWQENHFSAYLPAARHWVGTVYEAPAQGQKIRIPVRIEGLRQPGSDHWLPATGNLMLFLEPGPDTEMLRYGDRLCFQAGVQATEGPKNPHAFDYSRYLHYKNLHYQAFVQADSLQLIASHQGWRIWEMAYESRSRLLELLQKYFPQAQEYAVASALLVGYTQDLSDELRSAYAETGSMHALAVSGTHIGMLYTGLMFLVARLKWRGKSGRIAEAVIVLFVIWAFTLLTGATASVLRASVMFSVYMLGKAFWRQASAWNVLPASALMLLLHNPYLLFDVGFQLSYTAVAGMVFFYPRFYKMFPPMSRWLNEPLKVLLVGVSAQLGTLPLTLYYFHQFPVYFWLSGWVVVLVGAVFLWGGALLVLLDSVQAGIAEILGTMLFKMLHWMNKIIFLIQELPGAVVRNIWIPDWFLLFLYIGLGFFGATLATRKGKWLMGMAGVLILWGLQQTHAVWRNQRQAAMLMYNLKDGRLVDFIMGETVITLSDSLSEKQENFAAQSHRIACGIHEKLVFYPGDSLYYEDHHLLISWPYVQFHDLRLAFVDPLHIRQELPTHLTVLSKNPRNVQLNPGVQQVLVDATNSRAQAAKWRNVCMQQGMSWYDLRQSGAYVYLPGKQ